MTILIKCIVKIETNLFLMTDPTQFIVDQQNIHKVLSHEGVLGKGRDFMTDQSCSLHLYNDKFKKIYVMQLFQGVSQEFVSDKVTRITKTVHSNFICNLTKVSFISTRKNSKGLFDLCVFYDASGVYGFSLQYVIKMKIKNQEKFAEDQLIGFFWQISDYLLLNGQHTGQFLEITPVNVFCKQQDYYGYNFFPNNFGLNFNGTKWQRNYHNPKDKFWNGQKTLECAMKAAMFIFGMVLLQLCSLLPPSDLYQQKTINQKSLKKRIQGIKITNNPTICSVIKSLLTLNENQRISIKQIYENKQLLKTRKTDYYENKAGIYQFKSFQGLVSFDKKSAVGEALDGEMCLQRGRFQGGKLQGLCLKEFKDQSFKVGLFQQGIFQEGISIRKNQSIIILNRAQQKYRGIMLKLNISMIKNQKKVAVAFEGQFNEQKPLHGKMYYSDGTQQQI